MMYQLLKGDHVMLRTETSSFDFDNPPMDPHKLVNNLKYKMIDSFGVGLSANQVGIPYSVFVIGDPSDPDNIEAVFNPKIVFQSPQRRILEEGCLSYPGLFISIKRPAIIRVRYQNADGEVTTKMFDGMPARAFLHEHDHLMGITFDRRAGAVALRRAHNQKIKLDRMRKRKQAHESNRP